MHEIRNNRNEILCYYKSRQIEDINNIDNHGEFGRSTNNNEILQLFSDNKLIKVENKINVNKNENEERYDMKNNQSKEVKIEVKKEYSNKSQFGMFG